MNTKTLGLIHTSATLVPIFQELCNTHLPNVKVFNMVDDSLIKDVIARNELTKVTARRVVDQVGLAADAGADLILVTCSSIGPAVETAAGLTTVPVMRVDQPMADLAVSLGKRIGVIATLSTTLAPTSDLVKRRAAAAGKDIALTAKLCEGAFEALMGGNPAKHDQMVAEALIALSREVDVIVLAQASMSRVVDNLAEADKKVPILASPSLAIAHIGSIITFENENFKEMLFRYLFNCNLHTGDWFAIVEPIPLATWSGDCDSQSVNRNRRHKFT